jgi:hypothetical protein
VSGAAGTPESAAPSAPFAPGPPAPLLPSPPTMCCRDVINISMESM